jgi:prevent-host-death family protein
MNVGIRELKAHLSEYVRKAAGGELILVTDRGRPVARLSGLGGASVVEKGIAEGWITPPVRSGLTPAVYKKASLSSMEVIDEDRG